MRIIRAINALKCRIKHYRCWEKRGKGRTDGLLGTGPKRYTYWCPKGGKTRVTKRRALPKERYRTVDPA